MECMECIGKLKLNLYLGHEVNIKKDKCLYRDIIIYNNTIFHINSINTAVCF